MKVRIRDNGYKEIEVQDGYYRQGEDVYSLQGDNVVRCFILKDYVSIGSSVNQYDNMDQAIQIPKDEFDAQLEKAFEIIRKKLNKPILEVTE